MTSIFEAQPAAVQAVITIAGLDEPERTVIARGIYPHHCDVIEELADQLARIVAFETGYPSEVLLAHFGRRVSVLSPISVCEELAEELRAEVLVSAQLVASLASIGRAA